ncbi:hypothetical protein T484DRAFT_3483102 [Baffinella frigidus]|nr:hypothetical protein T484DRAFT_3483102 [Cryptophyta sp. CCMP2293]
MAPMFSGGGSGSLFGGWGANQVNPSSDLPAKIGGEGGGSDTSAGDVTSAVASENKTVASGKAPSLFGKSGDDPLVPKPKSPVSTLNPKPCTLHPAPCTLHPAPCTLHPAP